MVVVAASGGKHGTAIVRFPVLLGRLDSMVAPPSSAS